MATLNAGSRLNVNERLVSDSGAYVLIMQSDGNLVLYAGANAIWATDTWNLPPRACVRPTSN
jgi:hypothetical protein